MLDISKGNEKLWEENKHLKNKVNNNTIFIIIFVETRLFS